MEGRLLKTVDVVHEESNKRYIVIDLWFPLP